MKRRALNTRGFTLLEVLLSLIIFILLAGGIFAAVTVSTRVSTDLTLARLDTERLDALQRFLRAMFSNLSGAAQLELRIRKEDGGAELLIASAPEFTNFSAQSLPSGGCALGAIPDGAGAAVFSVTNFDDQASPTVRDRQLQGAAWVAMLPRVNAVKWRFANNEGGGLQETWNPNNGRPGLADLEILFPDGGKTHWQFFIPAVSAAKNISAP